METTDECANQRVHFTRYRAKMTRDVRSEATGEHHAET
jgi:hypothetical protein